jgi:hypothetical protein
VTATAAAPVAGRADGRARSGRRRSHRLHFRRFATDRHRRDHHRHAPEPADDSDFRYRGAGQLRLRASRPTQVFGGLAAGAYAVSVLPDGWQISAITCEGDTDAGSVINLTTAQATIDLDAGEAITCRFASRRETTPPPPPTWRIYLPFSRRS